jgi:hypothetical protein
VALVLFATEPVPIDITAIGVMVALLLVEPVSAILASVGLLAEPLAVLSDPEAGLTVVDQGLSGFANAATITVLAMFEFTVLGAVVTTLDIATIWGL